MLTTPRLGSETQMDLNSHRWPNENDLLEKYAFARQLTHQINNELASTIRLANALALESKSDDVKDALAAVIQHANDAALVYRALHIPAGVILMDAASYVRTLCQAISLANLQYLNIMLVLRETKMQLPASHCWRIGMIIAELISEASRQTFSDRSGRILVELRERGSFVECTVADNGLASPCVTSGQGSGIAFQLARDIGGEVVRRFEADGTKAILSFPSAKSKVEL